MSRIADQDRDERDARSRQRAASSQRSRGPASSFAAGAQRPGGDEERPHREQLEQQQFAHPVAAEVALQRPRPASPGRRRSPASATRRRANGSTVSAAARTTAATAKAPRLTLVRTSAASSAPQAPPHPGRAPARAGDGEQGEGPEQQHAEALGMHRLVGQHVESREGGDHRGDAEREAAGQPLRGEPVEEAGRRPRRRSRSSGWRRWSRPCRQARRGRRRARSRRGRRASRRRGRGRRRGRRP